MENNETLVKARSLALITRILVDSSWEAHPAEIIKTDSVEKTEKINRITTEMAQFIPVKIRKIHMGIEYGRMTFSGL